MQLRSVTRAVVALDKDFHLADHAHAGRTSAGLLSRFVLLSITIIKRHKSVILRKSGRGPIKTFVFINVPATMTFQGLTAT